MLRLPRRILLRGDVGSIVRHKFLFTTAVKENMEEPGSRSMSDEYHVFEEKVKYLPGPIEQRTRCL